MLVWKNTFFSFKPAAIWGKRQTISYQGGCIVQCNLNCIKSLYNPQEIKTLAKNRL